MKIIQIIGDSTLSGAPRHVLDLSRELKKDGYEVEIICPEGPMVSAYRLSQIAYRNIKMESGNDREAIEKVKDIINSQLARLPAPERSDGGQAIRNSLIIHTHGTRGGAIGRRAASYFKGLPVIYTEHLWTADYHLRNPLREWAQIAGLRFLDQFTTKTIAVSKAVRQFLIDKKITSPEKIVVIYNGIAISLKPMLHITKPKLTVGSIGSLNHQKGYQYLIEAARKLPELKFEIVGEGELSQNLKLKTKNLKLKNIEFLGQVENLNKKYQDWDIYVQPSLSESFGIAIAEAMSYGIPVVATNVGGIPELVDDRQTGLLVPTKNIKELETAILELAEDEKLRQKLGQAGQEKIAKEFNLNTMIKKTEAIYEQVIK